MWGVPGPAAYTIRAPAPKRDMCDLMLFPFFAAHAKWSSWDTWCSHAGFLLLLQICRGAFILRLLLLLMRLLLLLLLLLTLLLLTLRLTHFFLAAPAPAITIGLLGPHLVRPYGCHRNDPRSSCP